MEKEVKFIYIVGRGFSGTTMLDALLGNSGQIESVGELVSGLSRYDIELCSCGKLTEDCIFWQTIKKEFNLRNGDNSFTAFAKQSIDQANVKNYFSTLFNIQKYRGLAASNRIMYEAIASVNGRNWVLDSSKEITRGLFLARLDNRVKFIHVIRRPEGQISSLYYRLNKGLPLKFLRKEYYPKYKFLPISFEAIAWSMGNLLAEFLKLFAPKRTIRIKFENLLNNPAHELDRLGKFLNINFDEIKNKIQNNEDFYVNHSMGGNEFRHEKVFKFQKEAKTRRVMPLGFKIWIKILCWPLIIIYGYNIFKNE